MSVNCKLAAPQTDPRSLISPKLGRNMKKQQLLVHDPTSSAINQQSSSSPCPTSPSPQPKLFAKPLKKFSLASAFPPSPSVLHKQKDAKSASPTSGAINEKSNGHAKKSDQSEYAERKYSSPLDYRDSGVYLGEIRRDPVLEMLNMRKVKSPVSSLELTSPISSSSAPPLDTVTAHPNPMDTSKSLPLMNSSVICDRINEKRRSNSRSSARESSLPSLSDIDYLIDEESQEEMPDLDEDESKHTRPVSALERIDRNSTDDLLSMRNEVTKKDCLNLHSKAACLFINTPSPFLFRKNRKASDSKLVDPQKKSGNQKNALVRHPTSFFRRSRSLTNRESRTKKKKEHQSNVDKQIIDPLSITARYRTGSTGDEIEPVTNDERRQRKISQPAMVRFQIENEPAGFDDRKTSVAKKKKSFADPIAKKLSFLRRRPTDTSIGSDQISDTACTSPTSANAPQGMKIPSRDEVRKWATSFEDLLCHPYGTMLFRLFLKREFSEENIDFWMACEKYKQIRDIDQLPCTAKQIYNDFVAVQAPKEVNLDSVTRSITSDGCDCPSRNTFEQAQHRIQSLMEKDSYPRFLRSDLYLDRLKKC